MGHVLWTRRIVLLSAWTLTISLFSWSQQGRPLFTLLDPRTTGVKFINTIREDDSLNIFRYEYLYNGHGLGLADFNKDGLTDIFLSGNTGSNALYLNKGNLQFEEITNKAGVSGNHT